MFFINAALSLEGIRTDIICCYADTSTLCERQTLCTGIAGVISNMTAAEQSMGYIPSTRVAVPSLSSTSSGSGGSTSSRDIDQLVESARFTGQYSITQDMVSQTGRCERQS